MARLSISILFLAATGGAARAQPASSPSPIAPAAAPGAPGETAAPWAAVEDKPPFGRPTNFLARVGAEFGGDELARVEKSGGDTSTLDAGGLATVALGFIYQPSSYAIEMTVGYKVGSLEASNGTVEFTRYPVDFVVSVAPGRGRIGLGLTYQFNPSISCNVRAVCSGDVVFDEPLGALLQFAYTIPFSSAGGVDLSARLTWLSYTVKNAPPGTESIDGSSFGLFAGVRL